jgi:hypothetical protein
MSNLEKLGLTFCLYAIACQEIVVTTEAKYICCVIVFVGTIIFQLSGNKK